jgi:hypothetical protein
MEFKIDCHYNPHLPIGAEQMHTVLSVRSIASEGSLSESRTKKVFGYLIDVSGSMSGEKLSHAKLALRRQLDMLSAEDFFFIVTFEAKARVLVALTEASPGARARAHDAVQGVGARGGTAMSNALLAACEQFQAAGNCLAYAQFVTDGENDNEDAGPLADAIDRCRGIFQCDCWGVGSDWSPTQLRQISNALLGSADAVPEPDSLEQMFRAAQQRAASRGISDVTLRLQIPKSVQVIGVQQQSPELLDLTASARPSADGREILVPLGAWASEARDYYIVTRVPAQLEDEEVMVFRPRIAYQTGATQRSFDGPRVVARWTSDSGLSTRIDSQVAHATGQQELADSIREGLEAKARGEADRATRLLGKAARLAHASGNDEVTRRLSKVVEMVAPEVGTVRLKSGINKAAELELDLGGTRTVRRRPAATDDVPANGST